MVSLGSSTWEMRPLSSIHFTAGISRYDFLGSFQKKKNGGGFFYSFYHLPLLLLQSKHPHVLYEYKDNTPQGCAVTESYSGGYERGKRSHLQQPKSLHDDLLQEEEEEELLLKVGEKMVKRDVRSVKKFIEVALVLDKAMFDKRPHSSRKDVIHDVIQVVNIADLVSGFPQRKIDLTIRVERTQFRTKR